jgi:DNA-binding NarL/FixJ family response regulator
MICLLLADDHPVVRKGLAACLARRPNLQVVGEADDGSEAVRLARQLLPDIVIMDIEMPGMDGLAAAEQLRRDLPQVKVLFLSAFSKADYALRVVQSGAKGYLLKDCPTDELVQTIEKIHAGEEAFEMLAGALAADQGPGRPAKLNTLSGREREILGLIALGLSDCQIARRLRLEVSEVETHRESLMARLKLRSVAELTRFAASNDLISPFPNDNLVK